MSELLLIKLGGSLITDKTRAETALPERIERLAGEVAEVAARRPGGVVVGHGSGSYGHVAAARWRLHEGVRSAEQLPGVARTQDLAARLHRRVIAALLDAGALPFSLPPSASIVSAGGLPGPIDLEPLLGALGLGLLPVVYGDVVMDRDRGAAICSTESLFESLVGGLVERGVRVGEILWLGETDGVYDGEGRRLARIAVAEGDAALRHTGGSRGTDVTGGMRHRLECALRLAERGVGSRILDGRQPGVVVRAAAGKEVSGTVVEALP